MVYPKLSKSKKFVCVLICALFSFYFVFTVPGQGSSTVVKAEASTSQPKIGETFTVNIKITNVQNLAGIDISLYWDTHVLSLMNAVLNLGVEAHPDGILHGNRLNYNFDTVVPGEIYVQEEKLQGSYNIVAQSIGQSTPAFSGSGTVATLTFNVTTTGPAGLSLESELADKPPAGENANLIEHQKVVDTVTAVIPEFPSLVIILLVIVLSTSTLLLSRKSTKTEKK